MTPSDKNLEQILQHVSKCLNIDKHRESYAAKYEAVRNQIYSGLQETDPLFCKLSNGHALGGSYIDNLKISKPDEYDLLIHLKLPAAKYVIATADNQYPGNVKINLRNVFNEIKNQKHHAACYTTLKKWVDEQDYLLKSKFQAWIESCFTKLLKNLNNRVITRSGEVIKLFYNKSGPAHTIRVEGTHVFSIDFVPAILMPESVSLLNEKHQWECIPKPIKPIDFAFNSFRASYCIQETMLISQKNALKTVLRIMKKFRDCHNNLHNLKSYFIKTVFMLKAVEDRDSSFWNKSLTVILLEMFYRLQRHLEHGELPFFWDKSLNMLSQFKTQQVQELYGCIKGQYKILLTAAAMKSLDSNLSFKVYGLFLTYNEKLAEGIIKSSSVFESVEPTAEIPKQSDSWCTIQ